MGVEEKKEKRENSTGKNVTQTKCNDCTSNVYDIDSRKHLNRNRSNEVFFSSIPSSF